MKRLPASVLSAAAEALDRAEDDLRHLPLTREVRELHRKRAALHLVVERLVFGRLPALTEAQTTKIVSDIASLANDVAEARGLAR